MSNRATAFGRNRATASGGRPVPGTGGPLPPPLPAFNVTVACAVERWLNDGKPQGWSNKTVYDRRKAMDRFIWWLENRAAVKPDLANLSLILIREFLAYSRQGCEEGRYGCENPRSAAEARLATVNAYSFKKPELVRIDTRDGQVTVQPNGKIRGRLGHGLVGRISREIGREDSRLKDSEGIPFWETHFAATVDRIAGRLRSGATAVVESGPDSCTLTVRLESTTWTYALDGRTLFLRETSRSVDGREVERTRYSEFHPNCGLKESLFRF
jgi:hypothetical protein